jgi:hypothetical protein
VDSAANPYPSSGSKVIKVCSKLCSKATKVQWKGTIVCVAHCKSFAVCYTYYSSLCSTGAKVSGLKVRGLKVSGLSRLLTAIFFRLTARCPRGLRISFRKTQRDPPRLTNLNPQRVPNPRPALHHGSIFFLLHFFKDIY